MGLWQVTGAQHVGRGLSVGVQRGQGQHASKELAWYTVLSPAAPWRHSWQESWRERPGRCSRWLVTSGRKGLSKAQKISCQGFAWQNSNVSHLASTLTENWAEQHVPSHQGPTQTEAVTSETESPICENTSKNTNHAGNTSTMKEGTDLNTEDTDTAKRAPIPRVLREKWTHHQGAFKEN